MAHTLFKMVGRPRQFDMDHVLDRAMETFWANGYEATSMTDLVNATGLHKGSLYQAFSNKHALFVAALQRYLEAMRHSKNEILNSAPTPLDGIRSVAHAMVDVANGDSLCPKGCMAVNTLVEMVPHDPEVEKIMNEHVTLMRNSLIDRVARAQEAGQIDRSKSPEIIAMLIITFMTGLGAALKGAMTEAQARQLLDAQLELVV